ncbi:TPA: hypothetical protein ACP5VK_001249 [Vibrio parahaemolyticus]
MFSGSFLEKESVQSFILRTQKKKGVFDAEGVIGTHGLWLSEPFVPASQLNFYRKVSEKNLLTLLRNPGLAHFPESLFSDPSEYVETLKRIFFEEPIYGKRIKGELSIVFCIDCIISDIKSLGFGYFYHSWLNADRCFVHDKSLFYITAKNKKSCIDLIDIILQGEFPSDSKPLGARKLLKETGATVFPVKMSPCLKKQFHDWLRKNRERLGIEFMKYMRFDNQDKLTKVFFYKSHIVKQVSDLMLQKMFIALIQCNSNLFREFVDKYMMIETISFGVLKTDSFSEPFAIHKKANCTTCCLLHLERCHKNRMIVRVKLSNKKYSERMYINYCDFFLDNGYQVWDSLEDWPFQKRVENEEKLIKKLLSI